MPAAVASLLRTPPLPLLVPGRVFDAFSWCDSDVLEWHRPDNHWDETTPVDGSDPARMVFVFRAECTFLPSELARLHAFGLGLDDETCLAPYAIDDATDELYARRIEPHSLLWLAADNLNALFWGLHDWAHFHSHGPFEERALNELQCDAAALAWLWRNRSTIGLGTPAWERVRQEVVALATRRFADEGVPSDAAGRPLAEVLGGAELRTLGDDARQPAP